MYDECGSFILLRLEKIRASFKFDGQETKDVSTTVRKTEKRFGLLSPLTVAPNASHA